MNPNLSGIDRLVRFAIGGAICSLAFYGPQTPFAWFGLLIVVTAFSGWCPIYAQIGLSTYSLIRKAPRRRARPYQSY